MSVRYRGRRPVDFPPMKWTCSRRRLTRLAIPTPFGGQQEHAFLPILPHAAGTSSAASCGGRITLGGFCLRAFRSVITRSEARTFAPPYVQGGAAGRSTAPSRPSGTEGGVPVRRFSVPGSEGAPLPCRAFPTASAVGGGATVPPDVRPRELAFRGGRHPRGFRAPEGGALEPENLSGGPAAGGPEAPQPSLASLA
jgi:hypothetical protein